VFPLSGFAGFNVRPDILSALDAMGVTEPFPIQALTLPIALSGADLIGQARTGTGKTLGFGIPLLQRLTTPTGRPQALVVVPTRELCIQVTGDLERTAKALDATVTAVYGGRSYEPQVEALRRGVEVVVGTPGRLLDLARQGHLDLGGVQCLVLDEADEMLDLGFLPDVEKLMALTPAEGRQTMLFSATMPGPVVTLSRKFLKQPVQIRAEEPDEGRTVPTTAQHIFRAHSLDKPEMIARLLQAEGRGLTIIFCRTKRQCDTLAADLADRGFAASPIHGDLPQGVRERVLRAFRAGKIDVLVATDVAARGIDIKDVTHVVNLHCPDDEKTYLHRIGRTGRAGESGVAVTFVDWEDLTRWNVINATLALPFPDPPETYSSSVAFFEALDIPKGTTGRLPVAQQTRVGLEAEVLEDIGGPAARRPRGDKPAGARSSGGRDRGRDGGRDSSRSSGTASGGDTTESRPAGPKRARRRTRGGVVADGGSAEASMSAESGGASGTTAEGGVGSGSAAGVGAGSGDDAGKPRRRRRGGRGRGGAGEAAGSASADSSPATA
jgi:superfamily II DNA/RNA helicase